MQVPTTSALVFDGPWGIPQNLLLRSGGTLLRVILRPCGLTEAEESGTESAYAF